MSSSRPGRAIKTMPRRSRVTAGSSQPSTFNRPDQSFSESGSKDQPLITTQEGMGSLYFPALVEIAKLQTQLFDLQFKLNASENKVASLTLERDEQMNRNATLSQTLAQMDGIILQLETELEDIRHHSKRSMPPPPAPVLASPAAVTIRSASRSVVHLGESSRVSSSSSRNLFHTLAGRTQPELAENNGPLPPPYSAVALESPDATVASTSRGQAIISLDLTAATAFRGSRAHRPDVIACAACGGRANRDCIGTGGNNGTDRMCKSCCWTVNRGDCRRARHFYS